MSSGSALQFRSRCHRNTFLVSGAQHNSKKIGQMLPFRELQPHFHFSLSGICHAFSAVMCYSYNCSCFCGFPQQKDPVKILLLVFDYGGFFYPPTAILPAVSQLANKMRRYGVTDNGKQEEKQVRQEREKAKEKMRRLQGTVNQTYNTWRPMLQKQPVMQLFTL